MAGSSRKFAYADLLVTASGGTELVAAVASRIINVFGFIVNNRAASTVQVAFQAPSGTSLTRAFMLGANGGTITFPAAILPNGKALRYLQGSIGSALVVNLSGNADVPVSVWYSVEQPETRD